jgi:hypothetical protein
MVGFTTPLRPKKPCTGPRRFEPPGESMFDLENAAHPTRAEHAWVTTYVNQRRR